MFEKQPTSASDGTPTEQLVERIANGDVAAERELIERYSSGLWVFFGARWRNSGAVAVEDLMQDTWSSVLKGLREGKLEHPERLKAWIIGIARNVRNNAFRRESHRDHQSIDDQILTDLSPPNWLVQHSRFRVAMVRKLLKGLSDEHRQVLVHFYVDELERDEICTLLEIDRAQLSRLLYDAKKQFRVHLQRVFPNGLT